MASIGSRLQSILWVGSGESFAADLVVDAPLLDVVWEADVKGAARHASRHFDAAILDVANREDALASLSALREVSREWPVVVKLAEAAAELVRRLRNAGASCVWVPGAAPATSADLMNQLEALARPTPRRLRSRRLELAAASPSPDIIGESAALRETFALAERAGRTLATVLLSGETGVGKEVLARAIHRGNPDRRGPFVAINCAAFPDTLLESELFGHVRGAFTGADRDKRGLFEEAHGGTLFLDEVGETSGPFQAKLLRALQEREVRPIGGSKTRRIDVRAIAASNRDLWRESQEGAFREDLYYRLAVFPIRVPPLRERSCDILPLAHHFLALHKGNQNDAPQKLSAEATRLLHAYHWPGNVRELDNEIQRAIALAGPDQELGPEHFSERLFGILEPIEANMRSGDSLRESLDRVEAWIIRETLEVNGGRRAQTARRLRITREGLYKKMKRLGIE